MTEPTSAADPALDARLTYLTGRRWYAGKGRTITGVRLYPLPWLAGPDRATAVRIELLSVTFADGEQHTYQLPLAYRDEPHDGLDIAFVGQWSPGQDLPARWVYDGAFDRTACAVLIELLSGAASAQGYRAHPTTGDIDASAAPLVLTGEQSNTSIRFGDHALLKLFRRVQAGRNPDIEAHAALRSAGSAVAPQLLSWFDADWPPDAPEGQPGRPADPARADLGMLTEFLTSATDGWALAAASVRDLLAEGDLHAAEVGGDFAAEAERLGTATAAMHRELAAAFGTVTWGHAELAELSRRLHDRLRAAVERLPALEALAPAIEQAYARLTEVTTSAEAQRVHGDFHLGQTMRVISGWRLIDFEGEPGAPYADRVAMDSPLRDVAGMLRSFDYAAESQLMDFVDAQLAFRAAEWRERNRRAFLRGYRAELAGQTDHTPIGDVPTHEAEASVEPDHDPMIRAYELDKAVYEAVYEADMRPDWLNIPMNALHRLSAGE